MFTRAETAAGPLVAFPAAAIVLAYCADAIGLALHPIPILVLALAVAVWVGMWMRPRREPADPERIEGLKGELLVFAAIGGGMLAWLLWLAWPHLLPIGGGSDLTHHLLLIDYIDRSGRLVRDPAMTPYLGEMLHYTPGAHLIAVLAGRWLRTDGLHAIYLVMAFSVAVKTGIVFLIALRCLPPLRTPRIQRNSPSGVNFVSFVSFVVNDIRLPLALVAPLLLFLPGAYFLGSFTHDSFVAQVLSELFAVAMWWAIVCWDRQPTGQAAAIAGLTGAAAFLTWPVWIGPTILVLAAIVWTRGEMSGAARARHLAIAIAPVATVAAIHAARHLGAATIAGASGFAPIPTPAITGWLFPVAGAAGAVIALGDRRTRTIPLLLGAIGIQSIALVGVARASGAEAPYLALKMFYLAIYPLAVAGACAAAALGRSAEASRSTALNGARGFSRASIAPWGAFLLVAIAGGRSVASMARPTPVIADALLDAGRWARAHVPAACVDYLGMDDDSAYWLHLVVLGNPRAAPRSLISDTFEPQKATVRWILPGGLPYAIAADVDALPRDIVTNVDVLARFGRAAVLKRRGASACPR